MNSKIKVVKRGARGNSNGWAGGIQKTERERERETADTVKSWITEWEERKRSLTASALALITGLHHRTQNSAQQGLN
jgi:hypothetical protein